MIVEIWAEADDVERARARSDWVWFALRAEHLRRSQGPAVDPRLFPALNIAGLAASAIHLVARSVQSAQMRRAYMTWVDDVVVTPRLRDDPGLADEAARLTAMLIVTSARPSLGGPRDQRQHLAMQRLLRVTVALLPPLLRDRVAGDPAVRRHIRLVTPLAIQIRGVAIPVERFWKAVRDAISYGRAQLRDTSGRRIRMSRPRGSWTTIKLTGAVRTVLAEPALAVLARDPAHRGPAVVAFMDEVDIPLGERPNIARRIENAATPAKQMAAIEEERGRSVMTFGRRLTEALSRHEQISLSLFDPPPAVSWLRYLRWPPEPGPDPVERSAVALAHELGGQIAFERLSALPVRLPAWLYQDVAAAPARRVGVVEGRTPMLTFHRLHVEAGDPSIDDATLGTMVDAVLTEYRGPAAIFTTLLRWGERRFQVQADWRDLPAAAQAAVIWTYADSVTDILCSLSIDHKATAELLIERLPPSRLIDDLRLFRGLHDSVLNPRTVYNEPLLMAGLEFALGERFAKLDPTPARLDLLSEFFAARLEDGQVVSRPMRAFDGIAGPLPSWLSRPPADHGPFGSTLLGDVFVSEACEALGRDPSDVNSWMYLLAWGPPRLPEESTHSLGETLATFDVEQFAETAGLLHMRAVAEAASTLAGEAASVALIERFVGFAEQRARANSSSHHDRPSWLPHLVQAAANASKSFEPDRGLERFCQFSAKLMSVAPSTAATLRVAFDAAVDSTPTEDAVELWKALLAARSY